VTSQQWQAEYHTGQKVCPAYLLTVPDATSCCLWQIHLACPQTLLPVLPLLIHELQVEVEAKRLDAIDVLGKLFTMPGCDMDQEYSYLFEEFLRRCKDQKVKSASFERRPSREQNKGRCHSISGFCQGGQDLCWNCRNTNL